MSLPTLFSDQGFKLRRQQWKISSLQLLQVNESQTAKSGKKVNTKHYNWASSRENMSSEFLTKRVLKQSPQLQRLAIKLKCHLLQVYILYFPKSE